MRGVLDRIRRANRAPFHSMAPQAAREAYVAAAEVLEPPRAPLTRVESLDIPGAGKWEWATAPFPARR